MIWIDLKNKRPTDTSIPNWTPWTQERWDAWLAKSKKLVEKLADLDAAGKRKERNDLIDANSAHWGELKEWLLALSGGKCWFSEVRELFSHYDVEHFRPKKEAKDLDGAERDGYWWLAFDYMNFRACGNVGNRKKGGWFPLQRGSLCSTYTNPCEESEAWCLIDPIHDEDVSLIAFDEEGKVVPAPGASDWEQLRVEETAKRLKLNEHTPLTEARRKVWQDTRNLIEEYQKTLSRCCKGNNPAARQDLLKIRDDIRKLIQPSAELSAVARWCLLLSNEHRLLRLL